MTLDEQINRNIDHIYSMTEFIKKNEQFASNPKASSTVKDNFIRTLHAYENIRKDTISLLESYFKQEGNVTNFNYRKLHARLSEE